MTPVSAQGVSDIKVLFKLLTGDSVNIMEAAERESNQWSLLKGQKVLSIY